MHVKICNHQKFEIFENNIWSECDGDTWEDTKLASKLTVHKEDGSIRETWYLGPKYHRFDGPAVIVRKNKRIILKTWYVYNKDLPYLDIRIKQKKISREELFDYVRIYPENIPEIVLLAEHNNWLNEQDLLLLKALSVFS